MEDQLIKFETAKLAKEKGFTQDKHFYPKYSNDNFLEYVNFKDGISAPTQSLLQKWLREIHKIYASVQPVIYTGDEVASYYQPLLANCSVGKERYKTYEDALEIALFEGLKLITL